MNEYLFLAKSVFDKYAETKGYEPDYEYDKFFQSGDYVFVVQTKNGFNNVIFARAYRVFNESVKEAFESFLEFLHYMNIKCIRIEGTTSRYFFLSKMFKDKVNIVQDKSVKNRNIFYAKIL